MKIVYICHPIGGDVPENLIKVTLICREINLEHKDVVPFAPYVSDCIALRDDVPSERVRGIRNGIAILKSGMVDELWLYGERISTGMRKEIDLAHMMNIPVIPMTDQTRLEYFLIKKTIRIPPPN
jgi:hypothetical protein